MSGDERYSRSEESTRDRVRRYLSELSSLVARSDRHHDRLADIDTRISVSGTRGKSTITRWLHDELVERDYDTYAKITGQEPLSVYNGREWVVPRTGRTTLYENEREIGHFFPMDAIVVENQGITPYTTRIVNTRYVDPSVVVVPNIREDHLDTLGGDRTQVARSIARSVPEGAHVICGEQAPSIRRYLAKELDRSGVQVTFVDIPAGYASVPGVELVYCLDETLRAVDGRGLDRDRAEEYIEQLRVEWTRLPGGRVFDAAAVNDVQSTEAIRQSLLRGREEVIQPLVYLRRDRPGRTDSYIRYLTSLAEEGYIEQARVVDGHAAGFDARTPFPVVAHSPEERPATVLNEALADGWPVILMGNATPEFMQELRDVIEQRDASTAPTPSGPDGGTGRRADSYAVGEGEQALLLERAPPDISDDICVDLLAEEPSDVALCVALGRSPGEHLDRLRNHSRSSAIGDPEVITLGEASGARTGSANDGAGQTFASRMERAMTTVETIPTMGQELADALESHESDGRSVHVCVDSVTHLIEDRSLEGAFRVLHALTTHLRSTGVGVHYHFPVEGYDDQSIATLSTLFDSVVTINENGEKRVNH